MFVVVVTRDSSDPTVHGPFEDLEAATRAEKKIVKAWTDWDWNAESIATVEKIQPAEGCMKP